MRGRPFRIVFRIFTLFGRLGERVAGLWPGPKRELNSPRMAPILMTSSVLAKSRETHYHLIRIDHRPFARVVALLVAGLAALTLAVWVHGHYVDARLDRLEASLCAPPPALEADEVDERLANLDVAGPR